MITTKQRAKLRALANTLTPTMQLGKDELSEKHFIQIRQMLEANELVKIKVLQNSDNTARELANEIVSKVDCEPVQVIGSTIVLYAFSKKKNIKHIDLN